LAATRAIPEKLNAAIDIYRRHGAGQRWIDLVEREKVAASAATGYGRH